MILRLDHWVTEKALKKKIHMQLSCKTSVISIHETSNMKLKNWRLGSLLHLYFNKLYIQYPKPYLFTLSLSLLFFESDIFNIKLFTIKIATGKCSCIHYVKSVRIRNYSGPYSVRMQENTDQNNTDYGHFSRSEYL